MIPGKKKPVPSSWLEAEAREQGLKKKLERYSLAKQHTTEVASYIIDNEPSLHKYANNLFECGNWMVFRNYYEINQQRLIKANLCKKHLLCGLCAMRRSALQVKAFEPKLDTVLSNDPDQVALLITFTVKNGEDLQERYSHLNDAKSKMIRRRADARNGRRTDTVLKYIEGGSGSYEFKRGAGSNQWNPHIHLIGLMKKNAFNLTRIPAGSLKDGNRLKKDIFVPLDFERQLRDEWLQQTGDSHMVDVRAIDLEDEEDKFGAICESFKYALKLNDLEVADQVAAAKVLQGRRLQFAFGSFHGVKIREDLLDGKDKALDLQPYIDLVYKHTNGKYRLEEATDYGDLSEDSDKRQKAKDPESHTWDDAVKAYVGHLSHEKVDSSTLDHAIKREHEQRKQLNNPPVERDQYDENGEIIPF